MMRRQLVGTLAAAALILPLSSLAENSTSADGYTIHHNAITTGTLTPEVAKTYGIQRSKLRGMLNVSVIEEKEGTTGTPTAARVEAAVVNLSGQSSPIPMREIKEQEAIYYVGEFPIHDQETLNFAIDVSPEGSENSYKMKMEQQFFVD